MCLPSFLRRCGWLWFGAKGMLDLVFWISHLCHEAKKSKPVKGMLWKPKCGSFIYSWMTCLFAFMYKLLCDTIENANNFEWEALYSSGLKKQRWSVQKEFTESSSSLKQRLAVGSVWWAVSSETWTSWDQVEALILPLTALSTVPNCSMPTANVFSGYVFVS